VVADNLKDALATASYQITHKAFCLSAQPKDVSKELTGRIA